MSSDPVKFNNELKVFFYTSQICGHYYNINTDCHVIFFLLFLFKAPILYPFPDV